jgi:hypothetical protein
MIPANAIVDLDKEPSQASLGHFRVEVWGREPHDYVRTYSIQARSDTMAAQEALQRFSDEIEQLLAGDEKD